jgi:hypothetical protein
LILDGHSSYSTPEFDQFCTQNRIITIYMPPHSSHLLQPLDVVCFSPLKRVYSREIQQLIRQGIYHIDKDDFLAAYASIRILALSETNIKSGFQATGLIPFDPQRILTVLPIKTPSPPQTATGEAPS